MAYFRQELRELHPSRLGFDAVVGMHGVKLKPVTPKSKLTSPVGIQIPKTI